jgi:hypothetical protein
LSQNYQVGIVFRQNTIYSDFSFVGDSTLIYCNASGLAGLTPYTKLGFGMRVQYCKYANYGSNGQTIATLFQIRVLKRTCHSCCKCRFSCFSYGINDIRTNSLTKDQLKTNIITCINAIKAGSPNTDIVLRMPNSFDIPTTDFYIKTRSH